ncbi:hypothetical protein HPB48_008661 [Haemaphysalis longicornis]|uniref:Uncharacterized protein n=1 Tax=Haemaphysalis longicornis TaxID=44386 RepID=A0A9J6GM30_HAELO|nr:hypothetical protein HPB48_008661 [Haemaphysalis longicornis]
MADADTIRLAIVRARCLVGNFFPESASYNDRTFVRPGCYDGYTCQQQHDRMKGQFIDGDQRALPVIVFKDWTPPGVPIIKWHMTSVTSHHLRRLL